MNKKRDGFDSYHNFQSFNFWYKTNSKLEWLWFCLLKPKTKCLACTTRGLYSASRAKNQKRYKTNNQKFCVQWFPIKAKQCFLFLSFPSEWFARTSLLLCMDLRVTSEIVEKIVESWEGDLAMTYRWESWAGWWCLGLLRDSEVLPWLDWWWLLLELPKRKKRNLKKLQR